LSVDAYRRVVQDISCKVRFRHDETAVDQLRKWIGKAAKIQGKYDGLVLFGRDGVLDHDASNSLRLRDVTDAGCNVIFNQRMKQSGKRWTRGGCRQFVDLRAACRSKLCSRIWVRRLDDKIDLPETNSRIRDNVTPNLTKTA
jgi:hypothetical protein